MNANRVQLSQAEFPQYGIAPFDWQKIPSEASIIFPRLPAHIKNLILRKISHGRQIEPFRKLLNDHPNELIIGHTTLHTLFRLCSECYNFKFLKKLVAHPNFSIFRQTQDGISNVAPWFYLTRGGRSLGFLMNLTCQLDPTSLIRLTISGGEKGLEIARKSPILNQLTADQLATAMTHQFTDLTPCTLSSILKFPQAKSLTCKHIKSIFQRGLQYLDGSISSIGTIDCIYEDELDSIKVLLIAFPQTKFILNEMIIERINDAQLRSNEFDVKKFEILQNILKLDVFALKQESKADSDLDSGFSFPPAALAKRNG
jgi:hypothetical protein